VQTCADSGVFTLRDDCGCGAEATTLTLDGDMACAACAARVAADPVARTDAADRARADAEEMAARRASWGFPSEDGSRGPLLETSR